MTFEKISHFLSLGEGQRVEFKSNIKNADALGREICGFLNTSGGYLICGVDDKGAVLGVDADEAVLALLEKRLHEGISPKAMVSVQVEALEGKSVVVIEVPAGIDVPYAFRNKVYLRADGKNHVADALTIRDIVMRREIEPERWERRFSVADPDSDIDLGEIKLAVADAQNVRRAFFRDVSDPIKILEDFSLAKYGRLTNGGDVMFASNPAQRLPQVRIRAVRYNSDKAGDKFSDLKSFEGPLKVIFEEAYSFVVRNTPSVARFIRGNPKRMDAPLFPENAVREALINALAHRDYSAASGGVSIHIFPRRLEIWNAGPLPDGVTEETLTKGQISILRNPDIAHALYLRGLMEKAGRGSVLMIKECRGSGLPAPEWKSDPQLGVTVTFHAPESNGEVTVEVNGEVTGEDNGGVTGEVMRLMQVINGNMKRSEIQMLMGLKHEDYFRSAYLLPALKLGVIEMTIPDKPTSRLQKYRLTAKGRVALAGKKRQRFDREL